MKINKLFKAMMLTFPIMVLGGCSSTSESEVDSSAGQSQTSIQNGQDGYTSGGVETGGVAPILTPEEQQREHFATLRKEHIIYFDFDRSAVLPQYAEVLQAHGEYLIEHPNVRVMIEGHADENGTPEYNIALGERRAKAVAKYLQGMGILPNQMSIVSYGEEKPQDMSRTEAGFAKNRRAVLVY